MRNFIIVLSVIFYALAIFIILGTMAFRTVDHSIDTSLIDEEVTSSPSLSENTELTEVSKIEYLISKLNREQSGNIKKPVLLTTLGDGLFLPGQGMIDKKHWSTVQSLAPAIKKAIPDFLVLVEGYTDDIPIRKASESGIKSNLALSYTRAKAAAFILEEGGIPANFMIIKGYGEADPVESNQTPEGRASNRRIEIKLIPTDFAAPEQAE